MRLTEEGRSIHFPLKLSILRRNQNAVFYATKLTFHLSLKKGLAGESLLRFACIYLCTG